MEPSPFNDIRTIWFSSSEKPHSSTDYGILLERHFDHLVNLSMAKYPNLWNPDADNDKNYENGLRGRQVQNFLSPNRSVHFVQGHYCVIKPFPDFMHEFLFETVEPYGHIVESKIAKSKKDGAIMGIVDFKNKEDAERAAKAINGSDVCGIVLAARYISKRKRSKVLNQLANRQSQPIVERKKPPVLPQRMPGSEFELLGDFFQQWAYFSELYGSIPLNTLIWNLSAIKTPPLTTVHGPSPINTKIDKSVEKTLYELEKDSQKGVIRKLKW